MLVALFTAILAGALAYAVISIALLTLSWLKNRIVERLKKAPVGITTQAVISVQEILDQAPEISIDNFGPNIKEEDFLIMGIKKDGEIDRDIDIIRAKEVTDDVKATMKSAEELRKSPCNGGKYDKTGSLSV